MDNKSLRMNLGNYIVVLMKDNEISAGLLFERECILDGEGFVLKEPVYYGSKISFGNVDSVGYIRERHFEKNEPHFTLSIEDILLVRELKGVKEHIAKTS